MAAIGNVLLLVGALLTGYGLIRVWCRNSSDAKIRELAETVGRRLRFGRPVTHTAGASLKVTVEPTGALVRRRPTAQEEWRARIEQELDELVGEHAAARAQDKEQTAEQIKREITDYEANERAHTRREALIAGIGLIVTIAGIVLVILDSLGVGR